MVSPRELPPDLPTMRVPPAAPESLRDLATAWSALGPPQPGPALTDRLTTLLRRLASVLRAEPFFARGARAVGAELPFTGLCGDPADLPSDAADVLPDTLRLLRRRLPAVLELAGADCEQRVRAALDELAAGFAQSFADIGRPPEDGPPPALGGGHRALHADHLRAFYERGGVGIAIVALDGHVLEANAALVRLLGLHGALDEPRPFSDFVHPDALPDIAERFLRLVRAEPATMRADARLLRADTSGVVWAHLTGSLVTGDNGVPSHVTVVVERAVELEKRASAVQTASSRDHLGRLPGGSVTEDWLRRAFGGAAGRVGVCSLDLDGFQAINDRFGDAVGDRLLIGVAGRLQVAAGRHLVTRSGGDEFAVLVADPADADEVCALADRLQTALAAPFVVDGNVLVVSASMGVAEGATAMTTPVELLRAADVARSWATALGGGRRVAYDHRRDATEATRYTLLAGLSRGIAADEFRLVYQPLVMLATGRVCGAEALVRWQHPDLGLIGPGQFVPLAEQSGSIIELGRWILRVACEEAARWRHKLGTAAPYVSVNVSPVQVAGHGWVDDVIDALAAAALPPDQLQLEITEQAVLMDGACTLESLGLLREAGVRLALDDFGTGWSSLAWLRRLPVDALKLDGSFIDGLRHPVPDPVDSSIVGSLIDLAHALGLEVTAEWVETDLQAQRLLGLGCDVGQGHWFGDAGPGEWVAAATGRTIAT